MKTLGKKTKEKSGKRKIKYSRGRKKTLLRVANMVKRRETRLRRRKKRRNKGEKSQLEERGR